MRRHLLAALVTAVALVLFAGFGGPAGAVAVDPPVAVDDNYTVAHGQTLDVAAPGVLANDSDPNGAALVVTSYTPAAHGVSWMNPDGSFGWAPGTYVGTDAIVYGIFNGQSSATGTVYLESTNAAPFVYDDSYAVHAGGMLAPSAPGLLGNDGDLDDDALTAGMIVDPTHGWATVYSDGSFVYTPQFSYIGQDSFWYWAYDPYGAYGFAMVTIDVVNTLPTAQDLSYTASANTVLSVPAPGVFGGASDADGDPLFAFVADHPDHGTLVLDEFDGSFTYTPDTGYFGPDGFSYFVSDFWEPSAVHTVELKVLAPPNEAPTPVDDGTFSVLHGRTLSVAAPGVLANDSDPDGDVVAIGSYTFAAHGQVAVMEDGSFSYLPDPGYVGSDGFTYSAVDPWGAAAWATVSLEVTDHAPVAVNQSYGALSGTPLTVAAPGFLTAASDEDGDLLIGLVGSGPSHGSLSWEVDGSFTYTPAADYTGTDTFEFVASDGTLASAVRTVSITVTSPDVAPVAVGDGYTARKNNVLTVSAGSGLLANDSDANGDALSAVKVAGPAHGSLVLNADGSFKYTPTRGYAGPDSFTYKVLAGGAYSNTATVAINVTVPKK